MIVGHMSLRHVRGSDDALNGFWTFRRSEDLTRTTKKAENGCMRTASVSSAARGEKRSQAAFALVVSQRVQLIRRELSVPVAIQVSEHPTHLSLAAPWEPYHKH